MTGEHRLTKKIQFELVYSKGKSWVGRDIIVRTMPNGLDITRYGFVVSQRIGKAVVRNRVKRRLREIVRQTPLPPGRDIIITARTPAAATDYTTLTKSVRRLLSRAGLLMGEYEGVSPGAH